MDNPYVLCPVDRTSREFRLLILHLQPNNNDNDIKCDMRTYSSIAHPPYTALSYTWGENRIHTHVEINGAKVPVRENLWDFLHQQQLQGNHGLFWIDALCIQQSDVLERNHQVGMMHSIYKSASLVLVWLGKENDDSDIAMRVLASWEWRQGKRPPVFVDEEGNSNVILPRQAKNVTIWSPKEVRSVLSLCQRAYWTRLWIVQEIMLAGRIEVRCGSETLRWYKLGCLCHCLETMCVWYKPMNTPFHDAILTSPVMSLAKYAVRYDTSQDSQAVKIIPFPELLQLYSDHECQHILDRVYGLAAIAKYGSDLEIDYRKSTKDVFLDVLYHERCRLIWLGDLNEGSLLDFGHMLERVLELSLPETELQYHVERSFDLTLSRVNHYRNEAAGWANFFQAVRLARENTPYSCESAHFQ